MQCQDLFSGKNKKNIMNFTSTELAQGVVKVKNSAGDIIKYFSYFFPENRFGHFIQLSPVETICLKCQKCFLGKISLICHFVELAQSVLKVTIFLQVILVAISPDSKWVVSTCRNSTLKLWDSATGRELFMVRLDAEVQKMMFTPDSKFLLLITGSQTTRVLMFQIYTKK